MAVDPTGTPSMQIITFEILAVLVKGPGDASDILAKFREVSEKGDTPPLASFYRALKRALDQGWLDISGTDAVPQGRGRPAQVYRITPKGTSAMEAEAYRLRSLAKLALGSNPRTRSG